jgi:hypothetical protein
MSADPARPRARGALDAVDLALRLTLLDLLLRPIGAGALRPLSLALAATGLLLPGLLRAPALWLALAATTGLRVAVDWPLGDNHAWLLFYWCLAVVLGLVARAPRAVLAANARWLIGLAFLFATLWKVALSPDFLDGTFFRVTLVGDSRLEHAARLATGLAPDELAALRAQVAGRADPEAEPLPVPARLAHAAGLATAWTVAIEGATALAFLLPVGAAAALRDPLLLLFCATTYAVAPVQGFGWLLLAMGVAQSPPRRAWRLAYLGVFALILAYSAFAP